MRLIEIPSDGIIRIPIMDGDITVGQRCVDLSDMPTIDAEIVKHGRWVPHILLGQRVWDCSECQVLGSPQWKRCPVCEAKMDGEWKDGDTDA